MYSVVATEYVPLRENAFKKQTTERQVIREGARTVFDPRSGIVSQGFFRVNRGSLFIFGSDDPLARNVSKVSVRDGLLGDVEIKRKGREIALDPFSGEVKRVSNESYAFDLGTNTLVERASKRQLDVGSIEGYKAAENLGIKIKIPQEARGQTEAYGYIVDTSAKGKGARELSGRVAEEFNLITKSNFAQVRQTDEGFIVSLSPEGRKALSDEDFVLGRGFNLYRKAYPLAEVERLNESEYLVRQKPIKEPAYLASKAFGADPITSLSVNKSGNLSVGFRSGRESRFSELTPDQRKAFDAYFGAEQLKIEESVQKQTGRFARFVDIGQERALTVTDPFSKETQYRVVKDYVPNLSPKIRDTPIERITIDTRGLEMKSKEVETVVLNVESEKLRKANYYSSFTAGPEGTYEEVKNSLADPTFRSYYRSPELAVRQIFTQADLFLPFASAERKQELKIEAELLSAQAKYREELGLSEINAAKERKDFSSYVSLSGQRIVNDPLITGFALGKIGSIIGEGFSISPRLSQVASFGTNVAKNALFLGASDAVLGSLQGEKITTQTLVQNTASAVPAVIIGQGIGQFAAPIYAQFKGYGTAGQIVSRSFPNAAKDAATFSSYAVVEDVVQGKQVNPEKAFIAGGTGFAIGATTGTFGYAIERGPIPVPQPIKVSVQTTYPKPKVQNFYGIGIRVGQSARILGGFIEEGQYIRPSVGSPKFNIEGAVQFPEFQTPTQRAVLIDSVSKYYEKFGNIAPDEASYFQAQISNFAKNQPTMANYLRAEGKGGLAAQSIRFKEGLNMLDTSFNIKDPAPEIKLKDVIAQSELFQKEGAAAAVVRSLEKNQAGITIGGSMSQKSFMGPAMTRLPKDIDVYTTTKSSSELAKQIVEDLKPIYGSEIRVSPKNPNLVEIKYGDKFVHGFDIHDATDFTSAGGVEKALKQEFPGYGKLSPPPVRTEEGFTIMALREQGVRKGSSTLTPRVFGTSPEAHRIKDVGDFVEISLFKGRISGNEKLVKSAIAFESTIPESVKAELKGTSSRLVAFPSSDSYKLVTSGQIGYPSSKIAQIRSPVYSIKPIEQNTSPQYKLETKSPSYGIASRSVVTPRYDYLYRDFSSEQYQIESPKNIPSYNYGFSTRTQYKVASPNPTASTKYDFVTNPSASINTPYGISSPKIDYGYSPNIKPPEVPPKTPPEIPIIKIPKFEDNPPKRSKSKSKVPGISNRYSPSIVGIEIGKVEKSVSKARKFSGLEIRGVVKTKKRRGLGRGIF